MADIRKSLCENETDRNCIKIFNYTRKTNDDFLHRQPQHGSPELRRNYVYPTRSTPVHAFQVPPYHSPKSFPLQELRSVPKGSPSSIKSNRISHDSPFLQSNPDESVNKIRAMFPTVSDTHIRLLLKKYHGREAVVISALQVERYPITTPGPFPTTPLSHARAASSMQTQASPLGFRGTSTETESPKPSHGYMINGSPAACYRNSPRPHSSPKLKLRYMKSLFPQPDETVILDVLTSNDNNIQKTTEALKEMGFQRKDTTKVEKPKPPETPKKDDEEKEENKMQTAPVVKIKSLAEKEKLTTELKKKYPETPDHLISIALESVNFDEKRACQILQIITQEEQEKADKQPPQPPVEEPIVVAPPPAVPVSQSRQSLKSILKSEKAEVHSFSRCVDNDAENLEFRSPLLSNTKGANPELFKGPNHQYLLTEYLKCQGPNPNLRKGVQGLAKGPNPENRLEQKYKTCGPNFKLRKGANLSLAKGSIFAQFKRFVTGESRVK